MPKASRKNSTAADLQPAPLQAPAGAVAPANLPVGPQTIAVLPKAKRKVQAKAPKPAPKRKVQAKALKAPAAPKVQKCVAKDMGHHYCAEKGCPVCVDMMTRG